MTGLVEARWSKLDYFSPNLVSNVPKANKDAEWYRIKMGLSKWNLLAQSNKKGKDPEKTQGQTKGLDIELVRSWSS